MKTEVTFLGLIKRVIGAKVFVEISEEIPSSNPIINGRVYRIGQVGSYVRIPLGYFNLYGIVSMVGSSDVSNPEKYDIPLLHGQRWIEIQLLGESCGKEGFQRGVSIYPTLDDEVHIVTEEDLDTIYHSNETNMLEIGTHVASVSLPAKVNIDKMVTRHAAILGSTGSGKSNAVADIVKALTAGDFPNVNLLIVDPHGEYESAFSDRAKVFSLNSSENPLFIPYWALSFNELAWLLVDRRSASESQQDALLRERIFNEKRKNCPKLLAGPISEDAITVDSPVPFNLVDIWYELYTKEYATLNEKDNWTKIAYAKDKSGNEIKGDPDRLIPPKFLPPGPGGSPPFLPIQKFGLGSYLNKIMGRLKDAKYEFMLRPGDFNGISKDLDSLLQSWLGHDKPITVLNLAGIPFEVIDIIVGAVTRILFESLFWGRDLQGIGRQRPLLIVFEEAHAYLPRKTGDQFITGYANTIVRRVVKEGRKYGIGALIVSQRPSELDETILSQCGTFFALRTSNGDDQARVKSAVPDSLRGLLELLPSLRTGEAIILGEAVQIPSRVKLPLIEPRPKSDDPVPSMEWKNKKVENTPYKEAITGWRKQQMSKI